MSKSTVLLLILLAANALAQPRPAPPVMSVCEVLADYARIADTPVVIVGRMESSVGLIDHYEYLSEDRCKHPVITHGHTWKTKIQIWAGSERLGRPPSDSPKLDEQQLAAKMSRIRRTTKLGTHTEPAYQTKGRVITASGEKIVQNDWAAVYGLLVKSPPLKEDCGSEDCRESDIALILLSRDAHRINADGKILPDEDQ